MSEQFELLVDIPSPVSLKPAAGRAEPVVWLKTLAIYTDWPLIKANELRTLFTHLTRRITNLRVLAEPDIEPNIFVGAVRSLRIGFDRR